MKSLAVSVLLFSPILFAQPKAAQVWHLNTNKVQRTVSIKNGQFITRSWIDMATGKSVLGTSESGELSLFLNGKEVTGSSGGWSLVSAHNVPQKDGSIELDLTVRRENLEATKSYVTYPGSSIIREWVTFKNTGSSDMTIENPSFLNVSPELGALDDLDLLWMTGGENRPGSWLLKKETLTVGKVRNFDSFDPFPGASDSKFGFKMGSASYAPWYAFYDRQSREGVFVGFDYFGRWASTIMAVQNQSIRMQLRLAGYRQTIAPGRSITTPKAFTGLYREDLDNAGNEVLDWQYQYMWDYTRPEWFPGIRMLGFWWNGTAWKDPGNTWLGGNGDAVSAYQAVFRIADLMSEVGADVYHRDWGWWDRAGDWGGPDFKTMGEYLHKRDMGELIYAFIYTVDPRSKVVQAHPDWVFKDTLDMSNPEVVSYLEGQLDQFADRFGPFEWRNDSTPTVPHGNDDTPLLGQDQGFREVLRSFLDKHPKTAFQGVNGGGNDTGYDYARYASSISFSDGAVGILRNYWTALILPPDKSSDIPDKWQPDQYDKSIWRGLLTINFDMTGDTWNPEKLEGIRQLIDIYHFLKSQGLVGRWVHVYRPTIEGDDPTMYFERLKRDASQGVVITKHRVPGPVTIRPKGLNPNQKYLVSFQESVQTETRTGASLMSVGIHLDNVLPGELIYLNVPYHPGSPLYRTPPSPPNHVLILAAENMGYPGIEVRWEPAHDEHWVSYYEILRDGKVIDKVAKGTYYFDHSAGADLAANYSVTAVNGGGLESQDAKASRQSPSGKSATILDDSTGTGLSYSGHWRHEGDIQPAYGGTLSSADDEGSSVEFTMAGSKFTWFTRMCEVCGQAEVSVDGAKPEFVDTYSANDIFGVGIYSKTFTEPGLHQIKITVTGKHTGPRGKGTRVYVDGFQVWR